MAEKIEVQNNRTGEKYEIERKAYDDLVKQPANRGKFTVTKENTTPPEARKAEVKKDGAKPE